MTDTRAELPGHVRYEEWDAAYVLGALSPAERREFEDHLAGCEACQAAVAELAGMPGLLGRLPADAAFALLEEPTAADAEPEAPPASLTASLAHTVARRRRRVRGWTITALSVAAAVAVGALAVPPALGALGHADRPTATVALAATGPGALSATVALTSHGWGTSIDMSCDYRAGGESYGAESYGLYVTDASGASTRVSTWWAKPGDDVKLSASTGVAERDIRSVQLRDEATGAVLLSSKL